MSIWSAIGGIFDPADQAAANRASNNITNDLAPGGAYWQAGQLTGDQGIISGAAGLQNANIGVNTNNVDTDTSAIGGLGSIFGGIAANGGQLGQAAVAQASADLANTGGQKMRANAENQAASVLKTDNAERNWAAQGQNASRAQALANQLQKQVWSTAVSHANFEAALAGKGLQNSDYNTAQQLALAQSEGALGARNAQQSAGRQQQATDFNNAMAALRGITAAAGGVSSTISDMSNAPTSPAGVDNGTGLTSGAQSYDTGYAVPTAALGTSFNAGTSSKLAAPAAAPTVSNYVNPVTGNTVNMNMPTEASAWGDWITNGSSLASV